jgi:methyl-accepting chemotaxis protein
MRVLSSFVNLKLRIKLLLAFGSILLLNLVMMLKVFHVMGESRDYTTEVWEVERLYIDLLEMESSEKVFTYEGYKSTDFQKENKSVLVSSFFTHLDSARKRLQLLQADSAQRPTIDSISTVLRQASATFEQLTELMRHRGFKDYGLEGQLRAAIHKVENSKHAYSKADMLTLRRHEKDFFLRRDLKYQQEFNKKADEFMTVLQAERASTERDEIILLLNDYKEKFNEVVAVDEKIGLQDSGLKKEIDRHFAAIKNSARFLIASIARQKEENESISWLWLLILFGLELAAGLVLAIVYANQITHAVKELRHAIRSFANGVFPPPLVVKSEEEIGQTKEAFNQLLQRIKAAQDFSLALGNGQLDYPYRDEFKDDLLAQALIKTQHELKRAQQEERIINWTNVGLAQLNQVMKSQNADLVTLGNDILKLVVTYVEMNQGALYIVHKEEGRIVADRIATYAYGKRKIVEQRIEAGQGLIGQCLLEKSSILLTEVPRDYVKITSGLGEATPRFIQITPLLANDEIIGIIELAGFQEPEEYQRNFIETMAKNIAVLLNDKRTAVETKKLLDNARAHAQQLASQEEEIRQNAEEMQAITEQLEREKKDLLFEIAQLRSRVVISY